MASIRKRGPYQYQVEIRRNGYPRQCRTFDSLREAKEWAAVIESEMARGVFVDRSEAEQTTLFDALERYLREVTPSKRSSRNEALLIRRLQALPLAKRTLATIRGSDMAAYRDMRLKAVKPNTVRIELALFSHLFTVARQEWGLAVDNPVGVIRKPRLPEGRDRRLTGDEEARLLESCRAYKSGRDLPAAVLLAIETGMRAGNIANLMWRQIDLARRCIFLQTTKNGRSLQVPLSRKAAEVLQQLPRNINGRVFMDFNNSNQLSQAFRAACKRAGIKDLRFHDLRHEAASRLAPHVTAQTLAKLMGWRTIQMSMRYYNPSHTELLAAVDAATTARAA